MWTYWIIAFFIIQLIHFLGTWHLYQKAGRKAWEAAIPVYNLIVMLKIMERPWWWVFLFFIPIIAPIAFLIIWVDFIRCYGKRSIAEALLVIFTLGFYLFYLNYVEKPTYIGPGERIETLISSLLFAVILATIVHTFFIQPYTIPTGSMEKTLLVGDFLFVSKINYGARVPTTPVALPFLQSSTPFIPIKSYIDKIRLPYMRLPGFKEVKRNDIVVFNFPTDSVNTAIDRKDPYVKRCVGMPGDSLKIEDGIVFINNKPHQMPLDARYQYSYTVISKVPFSRDRIREAFGYQEYTESQMADGQYGYLFSGLTTDEAKDIKAMPSVVSVDRNIAPKGMKRERFKHDNVIDSVNTIFPVDKPWNEDQFGPLYIPKKGDKITLTKDNVAQYFDIITRYEHNTFEDNKDGTYTINGQKTNNYNIGQNYYIMMGDNRHNSLDSRFWGFVPADHVLGVPLMIWLSLEWREGKSIRWDRLFTIPNNGEAHKQSYLFLILGLIAVYLGYDYFKKKRKEKE